MKHEQLVAALIPVHVCVFTSLPRANYFNRVRIRVGLDSGHDELFALCSSAKVRCCNEKISWQLGGFNKQQNRSL